MLVANGRAGSTASKYSDPSVVRSTSLAQSSEGYVMDLRYLWVGIGDPIVKLYVDCLNTAHSLHTPTRHV
jgi:hypothetical protein